MTVGKTRIIPKFTLKFKLRRRQSAQQARKNGYNIARFMKVKNMFQHTSTQFIDTAQSVLALARQKGAGSAEVDVSESLGQSVSVRLQEIEQIEHQQDKSLDITV